MKKVIKFFLLFVIFLFSSVLTFSQDYVEIGDGTQNITCTKAGYQSQTVGVTVIDNDVISQDFALIKEPNPPKAVLAQLVQTDGEAVDITWELPDSTYENIYDDGKATKALSGFDVYRLKEGQEGDETLWTLLLTTTNTQYRDNGWEALAPGGYLWAVKANYANGIQSIPVFSNLLGKDWESEVTVNVTTNNNNSAEGAYVKFINLDGNPEHIYDYAVPADGILVFPSVWNGSYDMSVTKEGYFPYILEGIWITGDITINVELESLEGQNMPPRNFKVDNQTAIATWLPPGIEFVTVFEEGFECGSIPSGWTQEYILDSVPWTVQTGGAGMTYAHSGDYNACFTGNFAKTKLVTPELDLNNAICPTLSFWYAQVPGSGGVDDLKVFYKKSKNDTWKIIVTYPSPAALWKYETLELPEVTDTYYLAFEGFAPESNGGQGICLDDVKINVEVGKNKAKDLKYYELFLDGSLIASTNDLTLDYKDYVTLIVGQTYIASIRINNFGYCSYKVQCPFTYCPCEYLNPPLNIEDSIAYNNLYLTWDPPSSDMKVLSIRKRENTIDGTLEYSPKHRIISGGIKNTWDLQFQFPCAVAAGEAGVESDGNFIYVTKWNGNDFYKYDLSGNLLETFQVPGAGAVRDLAYDGQYFYGGAASTSIFQMDFENQELVGTISSPVAVRAIAYDDNNDGFWVNNWSTDITLVGRDGSVISSFACGSWGSYYGFAYDTTSDGDPYLWGFSQDGSGGVIVQMNPETGTETGLTHDVAAELGPSDGIAGGLFIQENMIPTTTTIGGLMQNDKIFGYELASEEGPASELLGYNVYKNGDKCNSDILTGLEYSEYLTGGTLYYCVVAVYDLGESCHDEFPIYSYQLEPPTNLTCEIEGNNIVNLTWNAPLGAGYQVLWDQLDPQGETYGTSAQDFEPDLDVYDAEVAGDFSLSEAATIDLVKFVFFYANASTESFPFNVAVYPDENGQPGETAIATSQTSACPPDANNVFEVSLIDPITLDAGTYWLGFQIKMEYSTSVAEQGYAQQRTTLDLTTPAYWRNPGDGFETGFTTWAPEVKNDNGDNRDVCFRIIGTFVNGKSLSSLMSQNKVSEHTITGTTTLTGLNINGKNKNTTADYSNYTNDSKAMLQGYNVYRNGNVIDYVSEPDTTYTEALGILKLYYYAVSAVYAEGESAVAGPIFVDLNPVLIAPENLAASVECYDVTLTWDTVAGQSAGNFLGYNVYRNGAKVNAEVLTDLSYVDSGLESGTYEYTVVSVYDIYGESDPAGPISVVIGTYDPPFNLEAAVGNDVIVLTWESPVAGDAWLHYDEGINYNAIGTNDVFDFDVAIRFEGSQLTQYNGMTLTKIAFFPNEAACEYSIRVWKGANAATLLVDQLLTDVTIGAWNEVTLATPVTVDTSDELWFGYRANTTTGYPAGCDAGPAVAGYGDMIYDAESGWASMSVAYGLDYNWNIQGFVTSSKGETISLSAIQDVERTAKQGTLKVEKSDSKSAKAFEAKGLLGFNVFGNGIQINENIVMADSCIIMPTLNGIYTYWVTAVYDACESVPSNEVIVDFNLGINKEDAMVSIYPNPATDVLNIKLSNDIKEIKVYNYVGQVVYGRNVESSDSVIKLNTSNYNTGTYLIQFTTEDGKTITKKVVIIR